MCTKQLRKITTKVFISLLPCYTENTEVKAGKGKTESKDTNQLEEEHYDSLFWLVLHQKWQKKKKKKVGGSVFSLNELQCLSVARFG